MEQNRQDRLPWAIVLLIIVLCCAIAFAGARLFSGARSAGSFASVRTLQLSGAQKVEVVGAGFVYYDGGSISKVSAGGESMWNYMVGAGADFTASDAGVATWSGQKLTLIDGSTGVTGYSGNMDSDVLSAYVGKEYAAVLIGPEHNSTIVLMETGGRKVDSITLSDQTVVDYGFFYNDTLFWIMTLDTNGTAPSCTVSTYRPGRRMVGSISDSEQLLYSATFQTTQIMVMGDTHLKVYTYNGTEEREKRRLIYGYTLAAADESSDNPMLAFVPVKEYDSESVMRDVRMIRGDSERMVRMPYGCSALVAKGDRVYGFAGEGYVMIARMDRQQVDAYQLPIYFDKIHGVTSDGTAVLANGDTVYLVSLL